MLSKFQVFTEVHSRWPARGARPAGESYSLLLLDVTKPAQYALRALYQYRLNDDEKDKYWGKLEGKTIDVAVNEIMNGDKNPVLRGLIVAAPEK